MASSVSFPASINRCFWPFSVMCLSERERKLLAYHYGLGNNEIRSLPEVAAYFTLTEKYIRTMEKKALAKLKDMMNDGQII